MTAIIGIEGSSILKQRTGIGHYTYQLLKNLCELDHQTQYRVFTNSLKDRLREPLFRDAPNFEIHHSSIPGKLLLELWRYFSFPRIERLIGPVDLFHGTNNNPIPQGHGKKLLNIYDLYFMHHPERTDRYGGRYFASVLPQRIQTWDHIISISEAMKQEIMSVLAIAADRISIVPCGLDPWFLDRSAPEDYVLSLPRNFILAVGTLEPRKNYPRIIEAFHEFRKSNSGDYYLVIAGIDGMASDAVQQKIDQLDVRDRILKMGYLGMQQLRECYQRASLFIMISEYEGFGIPVLEAMASRTPVIASNCTSFPEVVGDAGILVDPSSLDEIVAAMKSMVEQEELRHSMVERGTKNISRFTWKQTAEKTLAVYQKMLNL